MTTAALASTLASRTPFTEATWLRELSRVPAEASDRSVERAMLNLCRAGVVGPAEAVDTVWPPERKDGPARHKGERGREVER